MVLYKFYQQFQDERREKLDLRPEVARTINHIRITMIDDGKCCAQLASRYYHPKLGARSLRTGVESIMDKLTGVYSDTNELITEETNNGPLQSYVIRLTDDKEHTWEIAVFKEEPLEDDKDDDY